MLFPLNVCPSSLSVIVSYLGRPVMFTVTRSLASAVVTLVPRSTEPPLPATVSAGSVTVRTGVVTDGLEVVGVVGVVGAVGVVGVVGVVELGGVLSDVGVVGDVGT